LKGGARAPSADRIRSADRQPPPDRSGSVRSGSDAGISRLHV